MVVFLLNKETITRKKCLNYPGLANDIALFNTLAFPANCSFRWFSPMKPDPANH